MLKKNERMEMLNNAGIDVGKYFTFDIPEGLEPGTKIHLVIDESGIPKFSTEVEDDPILSHIAESGYVKNTRLFRRFVMAQMFHNLNWVSYDKKYSGYNECIKRNYGYDYTFKMMLEEIRVLSKLEEKDTESFMERSHFFTKDVVVATMEDYMDKLKAHIDALPSKNCKGVPYKRIKGANIFNVDIDKKIYTPLRRNIYKMHSAKTYKVMYSVLRSFMKDMIKLDYSTPKCKAWMDAYKGEGAYYTMRNLCCFHSCKIYKDGNVYEGTSAVRYLNSLLGVYEGWRFFALMKKVIEDNNINTKTHIAEVCNK